MAITYPITFPTELGLSKFSIGLKSAVTRSESSFSFAEQVYDWGGQIWQIQGTMPLMSRETAEIFNSWLFKLGGQRGTFTLSIPGAGTSAGSYSGTPVVDGAGQTGNTLDLRGFTPSASNVIKAGDWFNFGSGLSARLYKFLETKDADGSGNVSVAIAPNLRSSPADGESFTYNNAVGLFRLADNLNGIEINTNNFYSLTFQAMEALNGT